MNAAVKMIHVARKELGLDEEGYRDVLYGATNGATTSLREMSDRQLQAVVAKMKALGFQAKPKGSTLQGVYAPKLLALWLSAWNLGVVRSPDQNALIAFVDRQTGISHVRWVRDRADAMKAIEALKKWISREAGVEWPAYTADPRPLKIAVIAAQHRLLGFEGSYVDNGAHTNAQLDGFIAGLGAQIRAKANG